MSKPSSSSNTGKQATLFGFFQKAPSSSGAPAASSASQPAASKKPKVPATPAASSSTSNAGSSDSKSSKAAANVKTEVKDVVMPASSAKASETIDLSSEDDDEEDNAARPVQKKKNKDLSQIRALPTPPLTGTSDNEQSSARASSVSVSASGNDTSEMDVDEDASADEAVRSRKSRPGKRQVIKDSDDESEEADEPAQPPKKAQKTDSSGASKTNKGKKQDSPAFAISDADEDEDQYDDDGMDWDEAIALSDAPAASTSKAKKPAQTKLKSTTSAKATLKPKAASARDAFKTQADLGRDARVAADRGQPSESYAFLRPERRKDADGRRPDDPNFDPRTIKIPSSDYEGFSPFEKQFWDIKKNHMDTVLFFQKGKFFELYETDADLGHQLFDLKLTGRVKMRMVGVPEAVIDFWIAKFLGQGYKVGRVDQAETAMGADIRRKDAKDGKESKTAKKTASKDDKGSKIVNRELKSVFTTGTIVDGGLLTDDLSNHCIAIKEFIPDASSNPRYGIVIADCSTAEFTISAFEDDACRTRLETTIRQHKPKELICERGNLSVSTLRLLRACVGPSCSWNNLKPESEFLAAPEAIKGLEALFYRARVGEDEEITDETDTSICVPQEIKNMYGNAEAMSAMGGMLWYLRGLNLDKDLFTVKNFNIFDPIKDGQSLILDGQTLAHIEVLQNSSGTDEGTLFKLLCRCQTPFGKRLFKIWLCQPLREARAINDRLDAISDFMNDNIFEDLFDKATKSLPDLERLLSRIHAQSIKPKEFVKVLDSFEKIARLFENLSEMVEDYKSPTIPAILRTAPEMEQIIKGIRKLFTVNAEGEIAPGEAVQDGFHKLAEDVEIVERKLNKELKKYKEELDAPSDKIKFKDVGIKEIYQIEVPADTEVPDDWVKMSGTKALSRYYSPEVAKLIPKLKEARERRDMASKEYGLTIFAEFDKDYNTWMKAVKIVAEIDCLLSLAKASKAMGEPAVRPEIIESDRAFVDFKELRHPCIFNQNTDFIPNNVELGDTKAKMALLTGPNMAGKSTLLRMTCVGIIMAQLGCYVPAQSARISPCDRIISRMGANDNMLAGQSTFRVEMEDCRKVLVEATPKSLVILDELGRGTSTFDGLSIAYAVLHQLAGHLGCIGFFATHFTSLVEDFARHPQVALKHMKTQVDDETREVTFLYRLTDGSSPKSYGPHVASMAGVPRDIVERAISVSQKFEERTVTYEASRKKDQALPLDLQADAAFLVKLAGRDVAYNPLLTEVLSIIRKKINTAKNSLPAPAVNPQAMEED